MKSNSALHGLKNCSVKLFIRDYRRRQQTDYISITVMSKSIGAGILLAAITGKAEFMMHISSESWALSLGKKRRDRIHGENVKQADKKTGYCNGH